jgi:hypothetical protein
VAGEVSQELGCWGCFYGVGWVRRRCGFGNHRIGFGKEEYWSMHNSASRFR